MHCHTSVACKAQYWNSREAVGPTTDTHRRGKGAREERMQIPVVRSEAREKRIQIYAVSKGSRKERMKIYAASGGARQEIMQI